ncbi:MAG: HlyD family efflux transporter periplasmic adaptor subunit [Planctomycetota bacterium]
MNRSAVESSGFREANGPARLAPLRDDLSVVPDARRGHVLVIDEIAGTFFRVHRHAWKRLCRSVGNSAQAETARQNGLLKERVTAAKDSTWNPLSIQIPLLHTDSLARVTGNATAALWTPTAIGLGCILWFVLLAMVLGDTPRLLATLSATMGPASQVSSLGLLSILWVTKLLHEWGHAVACDRLGATPKTAGVMLFFGIPCPYCDVTDAWRIRSSIDRALVMLAGIYIECWIAMIAAGIWLCSEDAWWSQHAASVMVLCGISTWVFNVNPLMRYDGYYVLCDIVGSTDLRRDARRTWLAMLAAPTRIIRDSGRFSLVLYHLAATIYRWMLLGGIAAISLAYLAAWSLGRMAILLLFALVIAFMIRRLRSLAALWQHEGKSLSGAGTSRAFRRQAALNLLGWILLGLMALVPLPRGTSLTGWIDVEPAQVIYAESTGILTGFPATMYAPVAIGDVIAELRSDELDLQHSTVLARQMETAVDHEIEAERAVADDTAVNRLRVLDQKLQFDRARLRDLDRRREGLCARAKTSGYLLPATGWGGNRSGLESNGELVSDLETGQVIEAGQAIAMIATPEQARLRFRLPAADRDNLLPGTPVAFATRSGRIMHTEILSIAPEYAGRPSATLGVDGFSVRQDGFLVQCKLPRGFLDGEDAEAAARASDRWQRQWRQSVPVRLRAAPLSLAARLWRGLLADRSTGAFR